MAILILLISQITVRQFSGRHRCGDIRALQSCKIDRSVVSISFICVSSNNQKKWILIQISRTVRNRMTALAHDKENLIIFCGEQVPIAPSTAKVTGTIIHRDK